MKSVTIKNFSQLTGYTEKAIRNKICRGVWVSHIHYTKSNNGRISINVPAVESWIQGVDAR